MKENQIIPPLLVRVIPDWRFNLLLSENITDEERSIISNLRWAQRRFRLLTRRKYAYFWTIYGRYLPVPELEYVEKLKISKQNLMSQRAKNYVIWRDGPPEELKD